MSPHRPQFCHHHSQVFFELEIGLIINHNEAFQVSLWSFSLVERSITDYVGCPLDTFSPILKSHLERLFIYRIVSLKVKALSQFLERYMDKLL